MCSRCLARLQVAERDAHLGRGRRAGLQHHGDHLRRALRRRHVHDGAADVAAAHRDEPVRLEDPHGLAQRGRAHLVLAEQPLLVGQDVPLFEAPGQDVVPHLCRNYFREPGLADLTHPGPPIKN
jgi:hypothetical protein